MPFLKMFFVYVGKLWKNVGAFKFFFSVISFDEFLAAVYEVKQIITPERFRDCSSKYFRP